MKSINKFADPPRKYNPKKILHAWDSELYREAEKVVEEGYGGVVTNVPFDNGFTSNEENHKKFSEIVKTLDENSLPFWIYDESGYPSGKAAGLTLMGHPEYEAKGFFMYKRPVFEDSAIRYLLPEEADKIIWAAAYRFGDPENRGSVDYSKMQAIPFQRDRVECNLRAGDMLYVFAVKTVFEGSHGMHNVSTGLKNINIMDEKAVRRFIDVAYEPIEKHNPGVFAKCERVFTDEPSLFVPYTSEDETWTYACAPYADGLFEKYEEEYGESLLPSLPLIFEGGSRSYATRVRFYELVGKLTAKAYSEQIAKWCSEHGTVFSGHYLGEDNIGHHAAYYGNYIKVLTSTGYPGIDILDCFPEIFQFINQKAPQMAARKMGSDGMMVELCPFVMADEFNKAPYDNMKCITALCYMHGVRTANSYFQRDDAKKMKDFNDYVGRIGYILEGIEAESDIFVYYPIEDAQAKLRPRHSSRWVGEDTTTQYALRKAVDALEYSGFDVMLADSEDIISASENNGKISDLKIKTLIIPGIEVIRKSTLDAAIKLEMAGVKVRFIDSMPRFYAEDGSETKLCRKAVSIDEVIGELGSFTSTFETPKGKKIIKAKFPDGDRMINMLVNMEREDCHMLYSFDGDGEILDPDDGSTRKITSGEMLRLPALRALFVIT